MSQRPRRVTLDEAVRELAERRPLLIGVDFDGTLAPIVDDRHEARPDPRALAALVRIAELDDISIVIVSGRARHDLETFVGDMPGVALVGEHGNDMGGELRPHRDIDELGSALRREAASLPGAEVETKQGSVVFHYRNAARTGLDQHLTAVLDLADRWPGVRVMSGKGVIELSLATRTKGDAIMELAINSDGVLYIGDDVTDETVFGVLGPDDIGVKVGDGETAASFRVEDVEEVVELLLMLEQSIEDG